MIAGPQTADPMVGELVSAIQRLTRRLAVANGVPELWTVDNIAEWLQLSTSTVSQRVVCQPDFPAPCQPTASDGSKRWFVSEVVEWARTHRGIIPISRRRAG